MTKPEYDVGFEQAVYKLRRYEYGDIEKRSKAHKKLLEEQIARLMKRRKFLADLSFWKEIYERSICFYPYEKKLGRIPCSFITKHNYILREWMGLNLHKSKETLVHFDTHDDFNFVEESSKLPELYARFLRTGKQRYVDLAQELVHDIGAAISGLLMTTGNPFALQAAILLKWPFSLAQFMAHLDHLHSGSLSSFHHLRRLT